VWGSNEDQSPLTRAAPSCFSESWPLPVRRDVSIRIVIFGSQTLGSRGAERGVHTGFVNGAEQRHQGWIDSPSSWRR
jgi:hypothetical protein